MLVNQIVSILRSHFFDIKDADIALKMHVDMVTAKKIKIYYSGAPEVCDICRCSLTDEEFMIDGKVKGHGAWTNMCADCFHMCGVKIGWGYGQLYMRDVNGWLLVGGFCPNSEGTL